MSARWSDVDKLVELPTAERNDDFTSPDPAVLLVERQSRFKMSRNVEDGPPPEGVGGMNRDGEKGVSDPLSTARRPDEQPRHHGEKLYRDRCEFGRQQHDGFGTCCVKRNVTNDFAVYLRNPRPERLGIGHEAPQLARRVGRVAVQLLNSPRDQFAGIQVSLGPRPDKHPAIVSSADAPAPDAPICWSCDGRADRVMARSLCTDELVATVLLLIAVFERCVAQQRPDGVRCPIVALW